MPASRLARGAGAVAFIVAATAAAQAPSPVEDRSRTIGAERVLELSIVLDAPVAAAWAAFATSEGFMRWAAPVARVDLRVGGSIESSYDPAVPLGSGRTVRNEIVALVPERLLVIRNVQAPPGAKFDVPTFQQMQTAVLLEPLGPARTRVTLMNGGYFEGERYDGVYRHFRAGNTWSLEQLAKTLGGPR